MKTYKIRNKADGGILEVTEDQLAEFGLEVPKAEKGKMIKRKDGSYSRRGLWDNIRANKGSGKKPTKAMLEQEAKIRAAEKAYGGYMDMGGYMNPYMNYGGYMATGGCMECGGKMQAGGKMNEIRPLPMLTSNYYAEAMGKPEYTDWLNNPDMVINKPTPVPYLQTESGMSRYIKSLPPERQGKLRDNEYNQRIAEQVPFNLYPYAEGGDLLPPNILRNRVEKHMSKEEANEYMQDYYGEAGDGKWIQKATASIKRRGTEGVCTGSKFGGPGCPPGSKRYNLAKTFRKMAKSRKKADGGMLQLGQTLNLTKKQMDDLIAQGYQFEIE